MLRRVPAASVSRTWSRWLSSLAASSARASVGHARARRRPAPASAAGEPGFGLGAGGLQLLRAATRRSARGLEPLGLLRGERRGVGLELRQLAGQRAARPLSASARVRPARSSRSVGGAQAAGHVGLLHLPVHPLLPGGFLLGLELGQQRAALPSSSSSRPRRELALRPAPASISASRCSERREPLA